MGNVNLKAGVVPTDPISEAAHSAVPDQVWTAQLGLPEMRRAPESEAQPTVKGAPLPIISVLASLLWTHS